MVKAFDLESALLGLIFIHLFIFYMYLWFSDFVTVVYGNVIETVILVVTCI